VAQFPERSHLVGAYALGKAQRVIRLLREAGWDGRSMCTARWSG
jgi:putative mRNA 3-end processing factor